MHATSFLFHSLSGEHCEALVPYHRVKYVKKMAAPVTLCRTSSRRDHLKIFSDNENVRGIHEREGRRVSIEVRKTLLSSRQAGPWHAQIYSRVTSPTIAVTSAAFDTLAESLFLFAWLCAEAVEFLFHGAYSQPEGTKELLTVWLK